MEEVLVSLEVARLLWEKGLPKTEVVKYCTYVPIDGNILEYLPMIPQSLAQKWLRETKDIIVIADYNMTYPRKWNYEYWKDNLREYSDEYYETYEEALEEGLKYCLESI